MSPFFGAWRPDVLRLYATYGLCEDSQGGVKLKTSSLQEAFVYADPLGANETWELLDRVDNRIELRWIVPGKPTDKGCVFPAITLVGPLMFVQGYGRRSDEGASVAKTCQLV